MPVAKLTVEVFAPIKTPSFVKLATPVPPYSVLRTLERINLVIVVLPVSAALLKSAPETPPTPNEPEYLAPDIYTLLPEKFMPFVNLFQ